MVHHQMQGYDAVATRRIGQGESSGIGALIIGYTVNPGHRLAHRVINISVCHLQHRHIHHHQTIGTVRSMKYRHQSIGLRKGHVVPHKRQLVGADGAVHRILNIAQHIQYNRQGTVAASCICQILSKCAGIVIMFSIQFIRKVVLQHGHIQRVGSSLVYVQRHHHQTVAAMFIMEVSGLHTGIRKSQLVPNYRQLSPAHCAVHRHCVGDIYRQVHRHRAIATIAIDQHRIV